MLLTLYIKFHVAVGECKLKTMCHSVRSTIID